MLTTNNKLTAELYEGTGSGSSKTSSNTVINETEGIEAVEEMSTVVGESQHVNCLYGTNPGNTGGSSSVALYGVKPITGSDQQVIALYGVEPTTGIVQPIVALYGVQPTIKLTKAEIEANITKLTSAATKMRENWESMKTTTLNQISTSWQNELADEYIDKLKSMDGNVEKSIQAIELLRDTYKSALEQYDEVQSQIKDTINGL